MSTLSGNATKGEKGKKFQQIKINLIATKSTEPEQQPNKSSVQRIQHGMTSLGKIPQARRPTNLPSEKSEQSGNDPSFNLVPSGGPGWGNKLNETSATTTTITTTTPSLVQNVSPPTSVSVSSTPMPGTSQPAQHAQLYPPTSRMPPIPAVGHVPVHHGPPDAKTWARMAHGGDSSAANLFTPQSPLFHHEFPSLSSNAETSSTSTTQTATISQKPTTNTIADTQYGPGPSLRPQTGSWMGGSRPQGSMVPVAGNLPATAPAPVRPISSYPPHTGSDGARNNLAPSGVGVVPGGPYPPSVMPDKILSQYGTMMPPFMLRNSYPGGFPPGVGPRPYGPYMPSGQHAPAERFMPPPNSGANSAKRPYDEEDVKLRSIIKEEDFNQMSNIGNDIGWAGQEDVDYNQKLKFSDDEDDDKNKENQNKVRTKTQPPKANDKPALKKDTEKENDFKSSKENLKEREKLYPVENRGPEIRNVWQARSAMVTAVATTRYQISPNADRFDEENEIIREREQRKKMSVDMEVIIQRAKIRKEEEEKRYQEQLQQAASLKLKKLNERILAERMLETKEPHYNDRDVDMLPDWEKEKIKTQNRNNENQTNDESKKVLTPAPVPVVKDALEFKALTQLCDRNTFVKKEKETVNSNYSRSFNSNMPPRFQNFNRQNSSGPSSTGSSQSTDSRKTSISQFSNKLNSPNLGSTRHGRIESESLLDKDREWSQEDARKERFISDERPSDRYQRENTHGRDFSYEREDEHKFENKYSKDYENDPKRKFYEKGDYVGDSYNRDFDREISYNGKIERKSSESDRSDKAKDYDNRRYVENETHEKESNWRNEESSEKSRHHTSPRSPRTFTESETHERKKSRDESYEKKSFIAEKDREYFRKTDGRDKEELQREIKQERESFGDYKNVESETKRDRESERKEKEIYKDQERKSPMSYEDRLGRTELREGRYSRESRDSLRDDSYTIQEERTFSWTDDADMTEEKPILRREHYKEERGDRYSHAQRHPPGPITREKLEAKESEADKRNLTPLIRSDKKSEVKKSEIDEKKNNKEKDEVITGTGESLSRSQKQEEVMKSVWNKEDKKEKDEIKSASGIAELTVQNVSREDGKDGKLTAKMEDATMKSEDKKGDRKKTERVSKRDPRSNWGRHPVYRGNPYGSRSEQKLHRSNRGPSSKINRRDSKYSESDYSDEISGSGREDRITRNERDDRPMKSKRYDRDDRGMDYRMDGYMGGNRGRNRDYYYGKPPQRGRGGFRSNVGVGKRMDGYGPPPSKSPFGSGGYADERRQKSKDIDKHHEGKFSSRQNEEKNWKKYDNQDNKSAVSSPTSVQTAEANEESFATASEGTDSEDNGQAPKSKTGFGGTKRPPSVVVGKPQRRNYRSTSRKRFESRRNAPLYSRKDSGSYSSGKRNLPMSGKNASTSKETEKYSNENSTEMNYGKGETETKNIDKFRREVLDSQTKKNAKSRNQSNSRKPVRTSEVSNGRIKNSRDLHGRIPNKPKKNGFDSKSSTDFKDSKLEHVPLFKGPPIPAPPPAVNAWDKPITGALRTGSPSTNVSSPAMNLTLSASTLLSNNLTSLVQEKSANLVPEQHEAQPANEMPSNMLSSEKVTPKVLENLDGSSPPVQTIIFENTNFKSGPNDLNSKPKYNSQMKNHRYDKDMKLENLNSTDCTGVSNFNADSSNSELTDAKHDPLQMALSFNKNEDGSDMKLDFAFDSEFSKLTEDNKSAKSIDMTHAMHMVQSSTDADLNFKIASVKKVWDGSLVEHFEDKYDGGMVNASTTFSASFSSHGSDPNNGTCYVNTHVETSAHVQVDDVGSLEHNDVVFSPVSQIQGVNSSYASSSNCQAMVMKNDSTSSSSNVCKVKPQPQGCSTNMANVGQSTVMATLVSQPPPMSSPSYTFSCSTPQPNLSNNAVAASALAQMNFPAQYGSMPPVPSPSVLFNSSQAAASAPAGVYQTFQIDNTQVAARSQFGQYTSYGLSGAMGQTSAFNQQSVFVQPPPSAPPPELYQTQLPQYRLQPQGYGNTQQITSPSTVLISSTSNSLMSATIKPSNQQISAIGTKTGFPTAQSSPQLYMPYDATQLLNQNFIQSGQLIQRPASNIVPVGAIQPSTSFYTTGTGAGQTNFFQPGTNSPLQPQGTAIGLTAFNTQSATPSLGPGTMPTFGSQLTQQFRSAPASYMKGAGNPCSINSDFGNGKTITLSNQHDPLNSVFPAGSPMNSNKPRIQSGGKAVPTVQQAMAQHTMPQSSYNYQSSNQMRNNGGANKGSQYPHPIQRPVSQGNNSNRSGNNASNSSASHRMPVRNNSHQLVNNIQQQPPSSVYYTPSSGYSTSSTKLETSQLDAKAESSSDSKLADSIKTINAKNITVPSSEKTTATNE